MLGMGRRAGIAARHHASSDGCRKTPGPRISPAADAFLRENGLAGVGAVRLAHEIAGDDDIPLRPPAEYDANALGVDALHGVADDRNIGAAPSRRADVIVTDRNSAAPAAADRARMSHAAGPNSVL